MSSFLLRLDTDGSRPTSLVSSNPKDPNKISGRGRSFHFCKIKKKKMKE